MLHVFALQAASLERNPMQFIVSKPQALRDLCQQQPLRETAPAPHMRPAHQALCLQWRLPKSKFLARQRQPQGSHRASRPQRSPLHRPTLPQQHARLSW